MMLPHECNADAARRAMCRAIQAMQRPEVSARLADTSAIPGCC